MTEIFPKLARAIIILKRINFNLDLGQTGLKFVERHMIKEYNGNWNEEELGSMRKNLYCVANVVMIWFVAFIKEYEKGFAKAAITYDRDRFVQLRRICDEHLAPVNLEFPDLEQIRNTVLAHGFRWKENQDMQDIEIDNFMTQATGKDISKYYLLCGVANSILQEIEREFGEVDPALILPSDIVESEDEIENM